MVYGEGLAEEGRSTSVQSMPIMFIFLVGAVGHLRSPIRGKIDRTCFVWVHGCCSVAGTEDRKGCCTRRGDVADASWQVEVDGKLRGVQATVQGVVSGGRRARQACLPTAMQTRMRGQMGQSAAPPW